MFRDNTPNGATVSTNDTISDYEGVTLAPDAAPSNVLPGGRPLAPDPGLTISPGRAMCRSGVVTPEKRGSVEAVYNGWFTMSNGILSQKGDSGDPCTSTRRRQGGARRRVQQHLGRLPRGGGIECDPAADLRGCERRRRRFKGRPGSRSPNRLYAPRLCRTETRTCFTSRPAVDYSARR